MKERLWAVTSDTTGNVIGIFVHIDDAMQVQWTYDERGKEREPPWTFSTEEVTRDQAKNLLDAEWVDASTAVELIISRR